MDLVEEQHFPGNQSGQNCRQVPGMLNGRTRGDVHRSPHLGGDDHRQSGLAQPGRAGQQHVIRRAAAASGGIEHQAELVTHPWLPFELGQRRGTQRGLDSLLVRLRPGINR